MMQSKRALEIARHEVVKTIGDKNLLPASLDDAKSLGEIGASVKQKPVFNAS